MLFPRHRASRGKVELPEIAPTYFVNPKTILGAIVVVILFFFAIIFAFATNYWPTGLIVSAMLFVVAFGIAYMVTKKPKTVIQKLEVSGQMKAVGLRCPNCSASVDANQIKIVSGVPYATCPYCGHTFEVTEEPKW
jgi:DNA-directed RNA polymerase subunit RPC12/RpoP